MTDSAIEAIRGIAREELNFQWFRDRQRSDNGLKETLDYGHAIIDTTDKLDQYLHSYGPMIESQWQCVSSDLATMVPPGLWIDYGCGQGLAGLLINDFTQGRLLGTVRDIVLIEPSAVALGRAVALYCRIAPHATVTPICKRFDDLHDGDIPAGDGGNTLHLFSNSLDILGFDTEKLLAKTLRAGRHTILSVSHDREFNGGTPRIESVKAAFVGASKAIVHRSELRRFTCDNPSKSKGVFWICELEIKDG